MTLQGCPPTLGAMADDLSGYFELAAQVIPVLLLALVIESGFLPQLRRQAATLRGPSRDGGVLLDPEDPGVAEALSQLGLVLHPAALGLDSGCVWGGALSALRLEDRTLYQVPCPGYQAPGGDG